MSVVKIDERRVVPLLSTVVPLPIAALTGCGTKRLFRFGFPLVLWASKPIACHWAKVKKEPELLLS